MNGTMSIGEARSDFIKEYIFPGGCLPSLSRVTSAMASSSRLCVEHLENIGIHYYQKLIYCRDSFLPKQSKIRELGFDEKFIRIWEYYFIYCAAVFKFRTLGNYQIVLSRPGNLQAFGKLYKKVFHLHTEIWCMAHCGWDILRKFTFFPFFHL